MNAIYATSRARSRGLGRLDQQIGRLDAERRGKLWDHIQAKRLLVSLRHTLDGSIPGVPGQLFGGASLDT
jgi:hypothetical protein